MIVVATWPLMLGVQAKLWGSAAWRDGDDVGPPVDFCRAFSLAVATIVENADQIADWAKSLRKLVLSARAGWKRFPWRPKLSAAWQEVASAARQDGLRA